VSILIFFIVWYLLLSLSLMKLFEKAQVPGWKALVPGLNFVEWCRIIGQKPSHALWLLVPVVNFFTLAGMEVDMGRAFGKMKFWHSALAVIYSPILFFLIGRDEKAVYEDNIVAKEKEYVQKHQEALKKKDQFALKNLEKSRYKKSGMREWVEAIVFAVFAAAFIRMFFIEAYVIPTSSMEGSLLVGDYLFVSKFHYGIRTPKTVVQVPLLHNQMPILGTRSYSAEPSLPYFRLPGLQSVQRNKPIVFNWPIGDSVLVTPERSYGAVQLRLEGVPIPQDRLVVHPLDKRDHYIKRCVAVAGDVLEIRDCQIYIDGKPSPMPKSVQFSYNVKGGNLNMERLQEMGVHIDDLGVGSSRQGVYTLTDAMAEKLKAISGVTVERRPQAIDNRIFPNDTTHYKWTIDNYGPLTIPKAGATIAISTDNLSIYERIISVYENNKLEIKNGKIFINGSEAANYTFKQNYYWAMGDNRHNSEDSRFWGFVPEDHVVGRPLLIWMSSGPNGIRWNRIFSSGNKD
jgi:signal peptidase I